MELKTQIKKNWNVDFITVDDFFTHVNETLETIYSKQNINDLNHFNKSIVDPTKMLFDSFTNGFDKYELVDAETYRQVDKSVSNVIGYFHQNIFKYIKGWNVPESGFDIESEKLSIFAEMKNKHNTMNSSSSQKTYMRLQQKLLEDSKATCYLVEIIAKKSQDKNWRCKVNGKNFDHDRIRRISIDKFYGLVTQDEYGFRKICEWLPAVIVALNQEKERKSNTESIIQEIQEVDKDFIDAIFKISYPSYQGFDNLDIKYKEYLSE